MNNKLTAVELFCGGGGLSLGLKQAGFQVCAAIDTNPDACSTYKANHPEVHVFRQDIKTIKAQDVLVHCPNKTVDLLAGCPPCQGFSSLTSKLKRQDPRNQLILEMARLIEEILPRAIMLENVPGLIQTGASLFNEFIVRLKKVGYMPKWDVLQVANYGVPQSRRRLVLVAGREFEIKLPRQTHAERPKGSQKPWKPISKVIGNMPPPQTLSQAGGVKAAGSVNWHLVRDIKPETLRRLKAAMPGKNWRKIPKRFRPNCHQDKDVGFSNVYGRMSWDKVSASITSGCTTFSMGRFGHPVENRTISIREAAMLQTFPRDYIIEAESIEAACVIVGNALPVLFARKVSRVCAQALRKHPKVKVVKRR